MQMIKRTLSSLLMVLTAPTLATATHAAFPYASVLRVVADLHGSDQAGGWDYAAVDASSGRLLVARMDGVQTVTLVDNQPGPRLAPGRHVHEVLPLPGNRVLFTNGDTDTASLVDGTSGALLASFRTGIRPDAATFDVASGQVLVMDGGDGGVTRIDVMAPRPHVSGHIPVGGKLEAAALDGAGRLFINVEDRNQIAVISLASGTVTARLPLAGCEGPTGLAYSRARHLLVSACGNGVAKVLSADGTERASFAIGRHPDAVIADPPRDRMFIPSGGNGTLVEVALAPTPHVVRTLATRAGARTGAYDPATERLYLPYGDTVRAKGQKPKLVPGSFGVLVVDMH
ncbi:YncE family protein [Lichenicoccus roseus]|uniref:YncE family protein n=1 Tax=Lichenicoccus roseus TaxID=2683649 RepID=A0A5R9J2B4_9PROT|nr:YncE family protein [Lichenicoccus roseus]TLU71109.1 YncE family protein [Lichenicoccus roseus]